MTDETPPKSDRSKLFSTAFDGYRIWPTVKRLLEAVHASKSSGLDEALAHIRDNPAEWKKWQRELPEVPGNSLCDRMWASVGRIRPVVRAQLLAAADDAVDKGFPVVAVARQLARHIDDDPKNRVWLQRDFRQEQPDDGFTFEYGSAYPVTWPKAEPTVPGALTSPPWELELRTWESPSVRIWSQDPDVGIELRLQWNGSAKYLSQATDRHPSRILTLHPFNSARPICWLKHYIGDFHVKPFHLLEKSVRDEHPELHHGYGPRPRMQSGAAPSGDATEVPIVDDDFAEKYVEWVADRFEDHPSFHIAVIPEFCMTPDVRTKLRERLDEMIGDTKTRRCVPGIFVPGSWYDDDKPTDNFYELWIRTPDGIVVHPEAGPATKQFPLPDEWATPATKPTFTLLQCDHLRIAVGLCRDLLDPDLAPLLRRAGVNLVIAPANTTNTEVFANELRGITAANQAIGVVANSPSRHPGWKFPDDDDDEGWDPKIDGHGLPPKVAENEKKQKTARKHGNAVKDRLNPATWKITDLAVFSHPAASAGTLASGPLTKHPMTPSEIRARGASAELHAHVTWLVADDAVTPSTGGEHVEPPIGGFDCDCPS